MPAASNRKQSNSDIWAFVGRGARRKKQSNFDIRWFSPPPRTKNNLFLTSRFRRKTAPAKKQSKTLKNNLFLIKTIRFWTFGFAAPGRPTENNQILTFGRSSGGGRAEKTIWLG